MKAYKKYLIEFLDEKNFYTYGVGAKQHGAYQNFDGVARGDDIEGYEFSIGDFEFNYRPREDIVNISLKGTPVEPDKYEIVGNKHFIAIHKYNIEFYPETKVYKVIKG